VYKEFKKEVTSKLTHIRLSNRKNKGLKVMRDEVPRKDYTRSNVRMAY